MKKKRKLRLSFVCTVLLIIAVVFEINYGINKLKIKSINYEKSGNVSVRTYLKENSYYNSNYLDEDMAVIANLIDYFKLDYNYSYALSDNVDYKVKYGITTDLIVFDSDNNTKPIYTNSEVILDEKEESGHGQVVKIDLYNQKISYDSYNKIVQSLKKEVVPNANLVVNFNVYLEGYSNKLGEKITDSYNNSLTIPITNKTININKPGVTSDKGSIDSNDKLGAGYIVLVVSTLIVLLVLIIYTLTSAFRDKHLTKYDIKINKILREFDRAITEAKSTFELSEDDNNIEVVDFMELLDVHDNINSPIIYYKVSDDVSVFATRNNNDVYYYVIKRKDFD